MHLNCTVHWAQCTPSQASALSTQCTTNLEHSHALSTQCRLTWQALALSATDLLGIEVQVRASCVVLFGWAAEFISIKYRGLVLTLRQCWNNFDFINLFCRKVSQCASAGQCHAHSLSSCGISHTNKFEVCSAIDSESLFANFLLNFHSVLTSLHLVFSE